MQMFSASSFTLFKTIKSIYMNHALNEVILLTTLGQTSFVLKLILEAWKLTTSSNP